MQTPHIMPAEAYDKLKASAEKYGGVGSGMLSVQGAPFCILGHAYTAQVLDIEPPSAEDLHVWPFLIKPRVQDVYRATPASVQRVFGDAGPGETYRRNDRIVDGALMDLGLGISARIPFETWAEKFGVVRGEG